MPFASIKNASLIFCLDFNNLNRINELGDYISDSKAKKVLIDHHLDPIDFYDFNMMFLGMFRSDN